MCHIFRSSFALLWFVGVQYDILFLQVGDLVLVMRGGKKWLHSYTVPLSFDLTDRNAEVDSELFSLLLVKLGGFLHIVC